MVPKVLHLLFGIGCLQAWVAVAGEIIILDKSGKEARVLEVDPDASDRGSERAMKKARRQAGKTAPETTVILTDESGLPVEPGDAEAAARSASEYLRPNSASTAGTGKAAILRTVPVSESERSRQRARSYVLPSQVASQQRPRDCSANVNNQVGTVGDGASSGGVVETGSSHVNLQSYCR